MVKIQSIYKYKKLRTGKYIVGSKRSKFPKVKTSKKTTPPVEKVPMGELMDKSKLNVNKMAFLVNVIFSLADIINGLAVDADSELKNVDPSLALDLMHPVQRIKIHSSEMVRFVDEYVGGNFSEGFGAASDEMRDIIIEFYKKLMKDGDTD